MNISGNNSVHASISLDKLDEMLDYLRRRAEARNNLRRGILYTVLLLLVALDIRRTCHYEVSLWYLTECTVVVYVFRKVIDYFDKYIRWLIVHRGRVSEEELRLLETNDDLGALSSTRSSSPTPRPLIGLHNSLYTSRESAYMSPSAEDRPDDFPTDVRQLPALMRRAKRERQRRYAEQADTSIVQSMDPSWKRPIYQLAPALVAYTEQAATWREDSEVIPTVDLLQYLSNLRNWISITILQRLVREIDLMNELFRQRGLRNFTIGAVGLEPLHIISGNQQFVHSYASILPMLLPFLDTFNNQAYLVQRIRELAQGSCIGEYRWNSGGAHNGQEWGDHLPTDAAILFHLFCVYMDSQLMPLPQNEGRPFHSRYVLICDENSTAEEIIDEVDNKADCAIVVTNNPLKPRFNFISEEELHHCAYDRNNLFYVIIQFLLYMRADQESMLEGVNLGKCGINIMCVIDNIEVTEDTEDVKDTEDIEDTKDIEDNEDIEDIEDIEDNED